MSSVTLRHVACPAQAGCSTESETATVFGEADRERSELPVPEVSVARVLVVEDVPITRRVIERAIAQMGHEVVGTCFPQEAEELVEQLEPDLVLLDFFMPFMDGLTLLADLRARFGDRCPKVLFVSAAPPEQLMNRTQQLAPAGYVSKPFRLNELQRAVNTALTGV
jgi:two-component system, OmpR family, response regulator